MDTRKLAAAVVAFGATAGLGAYAAHLDKSEIVHFWVAVPAGRVERPVVLRTAGAPVRLRPITIDLDARGVLKRVLQPGVEALSTHWILNVGSRPVRIRLELEGVRIPVRWEVNANFAYDAGTHTFTEPLMPGRSIPNLGIDWVFTIPEPGSSPGAAGEQGCREVVYEGGLRLVDADTGAMLTFIPITIGRGLTPATSSESPCSLCPTKPGGRSRPTSGGTRPSRPV